MFKTAYDLELGDIILEGRHETKVDRLDKTRCMGHVHVNDKACYDRHSDVKVKASKQDTGIALDRLKAALIGGGSGNNIKNKVYALADSAGEPDESVVPEWDVNPETNNTSAAVRNEFYTQGVSGRTDFHSIPDCGE